MLELDVFQAPAVLVPLVTLLGLLVGSFLNVVIHRLPIMMEREWQQELASLDPEKTSEPEPEAYNLSVPRSCCPQCQSLITAKDNIPLLSWLMLRGRCRHCANPISVRYPMVELITGLLSAIIAYQFGWGLQMAAMLLLVWSLIALTGIDLDHQLLPDQITLPLLWLGLILNAITGWVPLQDAVYGAAAGYLSLWSVYHVFRIVTGKEGMGYGDFKLLAALGAWFGWQSLPAIILLSSVVGAVSGIALIAFKQLNRGQPLPFGPFLAGAGLIYALWGEALNQWYWQLGA